MAKLKHEWRLILWHFSTQSFSERFRRECSMTIRIEMKSRNVTGDPLFLISATGVSHHKESLKCEAL
jgi:hypothetical protein